MSIRKNALHLPSSDGNGLGTSVPNLDSPVHSIAMILAHGIVRLHFRLRQKQLDNFTEQSVHDFVLVTKGETQ